MLYEISNLALGENFKKKMIVYNMNKTIISILIRILLVAEIIGEARWHSKGCTKGAKVCSDGQLLKGFDHFVILKIVLNHIMIQGYLTILLKFITSHIQCAEWKKHY